MKINRAYLVEMGLPSEGYSGVEVIQDTITYHSRWSVGHELVFKWVDGKLYQTDYSVGATEMQDEGPWENEKEVECIEVQAVEKIITFYEPVGSQ